MMLLGVKDPIVVLLRLKVLTKLLGVKDPMVVPLGQNDLMLLGVKDPMGVVFGTEGFDDAFGSKRPNW